MTAVVFLTLTAEEEAKAVAAGKERQAWVLERGYNHTGQGASWENEEERINGAGGELAAARYLGVRWNDRPYGDDLICPWGAGIEVRTTLRATATRGNLRLLPATDRKTPHVLAVGSRPHYALWGWVDFEEGLRLGREEPFIKGTAVWVPRDRLRAMPDLLARVSACRALYDDLHAKGYAA